VWVAAKRSTKDAVPANNVLPTPRWRTNPYSRGAGGREVLVLADLHRGARPEMQREDVTCAVA
jgi:hypothetical protein